jgi:glycosyltransferase involved in cell wall biosynthesis
MNKTCAIIIPVYNEEKVILETIQQIKNTIRHIVNWNFDILCINDGSTDDSENILASLKDIQLISHQVNMGYGAALKTGLRRCNHDWIFICDADGTYPIEELPQLVHYAENGFDMVVASRKGIGIESNKFHSIARWILRRMAFILTGTIVPDLNSGMRMFKRNIFLEFKNLLPRGFSFTSTITMASLYSAYKIKYVPIEYSKRVGKSNIRPIRDFFGFIMLIIRIASYFEPLRFFIPVAVGFIALGFLKGLRDFLLLGYIGSLAAIVFMTGVQIFMTGILAEVVVRKGTNASENRDDER